MGKPAEEILAEAAAGNADLIVLPSYPSSCWSRLLALILPGVVEQVIRRAACSVFRASVQGRFDCADVWGRSGTSMDAASGHLNGALETKASPAPLAEAALAPTCEHYRAAA